MDLLLSSDCKVFEGASWLDATFQQSLICGFQSFQLSGLDVTNEIVELAEVICDIT